MVGWVLKKGASHLFIGSLKSLTRYVTSFPDIHAVVEEVANLNDINLQSMMVELLQKWLPSASSKQQDADTVGFILLFRVFGVKDCRIKNNNLQPTATKLEKCE